MTSVSDFPMLAKCKGKSLIVTDGNTLLGGDDKAGVAEIMAMAEHLLAHPEIRHGKVCIGFTPDEEVGNGVEYFDIKGFGADYAYTVDGGMLGDMSYECGRMPREHGGLRGLLPCGQHEGKCREGCRGVYYQGSRQGKIRGEEGGLCKYRGDIEQEVR